PSHVEEHELYRLLVDQSPDATIFADRQGIIQVWNQAAAELFGFPPEDAVGRSLDIIIPEHLRPAHWSAYREAVASGSGKYKGQAIRTRGTHRSGEKVYAYFAFAVVK